MNPRKTRNLASRARTCGSNTAAAREPPIDSRGHFVDADVEQAHPFAAAPAEVMALTGFGARHGDVGGRPRAIARRTRGPENADDRRADGGGDVGRARVA